MTLRDLLNLAGEILTVPAMIVLAAALFWAPLLLDGGV